MLGGTSSAGRALRPGRSAGGAGSRSGVVLGGCGERCLVRSCVVGGGFWNVVCRAGGSAYTFAGCALAQPGGRLGPVVVLYRCSARPPWMRGAAEHRTGTVEGMVRTLDLAEWAGCWVALDTDDRVQRHAATLSELMAVIDADGVEGLEIMRAPVPGEPVVFGLG